MACTTLGLLAVGGFVTTYDAGMAVPDWPNTYGYNLFLYPLESWLAVWDVFLEHTHRLIAATVGILTIALAVIVWLGDRRTSMRWLGVAAVLGVSLQGVLGGLRVLADERLLARVHGCTGPLFFALTASLVVLSSRRWREPGPRAARPDARSLVRAAVAASAGVYLQIVAGAQLRHLLPQERTYWFAVWVWVHLICAGLVLIGLLWLVPLVVRRFRGDPPVNRQAKLLLAAFVVQAILGAATWVTNYGWPGWFTDYVWAVEYTVVAGGALQAVVTTAHMAVGSLVLAIALSLTLWTGWMHSGSTGD